MTNNQANQISVGYKQTEIGVIPEDWDVKKMNYISDVRDGTHDSPKYVKQGVKFITSKNIIEGRLDYTEISYISKADALEVDKRSKVDEGDILMSMIGTIGNAVLIDFKPDFSIKNVALIKPYQQKIESKYLIQLIQSPYYQSYILRKLDGGIQKFISLGVLRDLQIPLPSTLHDQTAIATALSDTDALIEKLEKLIDKKKSIKQGIMQQLLTGKKRLPGFSGEWEVKKLGEMALFYKGKSLPKSEIDPNGKYNCIHYGELFTVYKEVIKNIFSKTNKKESLFLSKTNDILMPTSDVTPNGLATASCIKENDVILGGDVLVIRSLDNTLNGAFFAYGIRQNRNQVMQLVSGSTVYHLYGSDMKKYEFKTPPTLVEQTAIATVLSDMDAEIEKLESKLTKYRQIKIGMMQQLLTGKIRLIKN